MMLRVQELCRKLKPVLGGKVDRLYRAYLAEDSDGRADVEQALELLAAKHLGQDYELDRSPFPPPSQSFAQRGQIPIGSVSYGPRKLYPFKLRADRLKEHLLICGRSGSGKTNLTFELMRGVMDQGIKVVALDWKRGYRDLLNLHPDLRVYTIGRDVSPFRFNPLIPPPGCEVNVWIKLVVDVIASAYLGGEGVISLLVGGLDQLYREAWNKDGSFRGWPTVPELLAWLKTRKLRGRAAMWQASAERILLAMCYGEFADVINTQNNSMVEQLLDHNVILEMDGLSSNSDRVLFSEALTLWLYRYRLAQGPRDTLTNIIVLEEAHNLLLAKQAGAKESVLETSIRMIRQYGLGYVFVDQSASLLSKVAFANSYATIALSQKLAADVRAMTGAMNLDDEQKAALSTLPVGTAVVRLADEHPEPFLVNVPRSPVVEGVVDDAQIRQIMGPVYTVSIQNSSPSAAIPGVPGPDKKENTIRENTRPPPSGAERSIPSPIGDGQDKRPHPPDLSREEIRFLADVAEKPLSTTISRYNRLHLSRRRGNAIRRSLATGGLIEPTPIATRSGQVVLYQLTELGRSVCADLQIDPGPHHRAGLEHRYWVARAEAHFTERGYDVSHEHVIDGNGAVDLLAERPGERIAIEVETGKSKVKTNLEKVQNAGFDRVILIATSPSGVNVCQRALDAVERGKGPAVELLTWLDVA
jgi:energy-coupling factor transporter ATP-binding protein EcfA2